MSLKTEISQSIQKNLPAAVAEELKSYLEQAKADKAALQEKTGQCEKARLALEEATKERDELRSRVLAEVELETKRLELEARERAMDLKLAIADRLAAEKTCNAVLELTRIVFKNPTLTYNTSGSKSEAVTNNGYTSTQNMPFNSMTTVDGDKR